MSKIWYNPSPDTVNIHENPINYSVSRVSPSRSLKTLRILLPNFCEFGCQRYWTSIPRRNFEWIPRCCSFVLMGFSSVLPHPARFARRDVNTITEPPDPLLWWLVVFIYTIREIGGTITVYTVLFTMLSTISSSGTVIVVFLYCSAIML